MKLLLVDDDADDRFLFNETVKELDASIECIHGTDGKDGIDKLVSLHYPPDYVFLDINMPRMNGFECLKEIRGNSLYSKTKVVIHSTSNKPEDILEAQRLGANFYLRKPDDIDDLNKGLKEILKGEAKGGNLKIAIPLQGSFAA